MPVNMPMPTDYSSKTTHPNYACGDCGLQGVKLWREYSTFLNHQELKCFDCTFQEEKARKARTYPNEPLEFDPKRPYNMWSMVCAVPTVEGDTFWGYTSIPQEGVRWWDNLPFRHSILK